MITLHQLLLKYRLPLIITLNSVLTFFSLILALGLRFDFNYEEIHTSYLLIPFLLLTLFRQTTYLYYSLNEGYWRYTSFNDLNTIIKAHIFSSVCFAASIWALQLSFPRSVIIGELLISIIVCGGSRLAVRTISEYLIARSSNGNIGSKQAVILGAGNSGHLLVKLLQNSAHLPYKPVVVLDDLDRLKGTLVHGIKVYGELALLENLLNQQPEIAVVMIAIPSLSPLRFNEIKKICERCNVTLKKLQSFEDIACLDVNDRHQEINIETMLDKDTNIEHEEQIRQALKGANVLITGAGGSIGSELARQILDFYPKKLILLDNCEYNLFKIERELQGRKSVDTILEFVLADICNQVRIQQIISSDKLDFLFHAAAYKHVPLMEINCYEAFRNNIVGTRNLHELALLNGVKKFIFISTDKAVDPSSVMGCSKKVAELMLQQRAKKLPQLGNGSANSYTHSAVVRFGNVINSTGSVIPLFKEQIANGGPITVTHPDMERFFMSIKEAVRLVLTAGTLCENGQIYVLDMGKKIKIVDLAMKMLKLYGRRDINIVFTGLRPGEKMTEYLLAKYETLHPTTIHKVSQLESALPLQTNIENWIDQLQSRLNTLNNEQIGKELKDFVQQVESQIDSKEFCQQVVHA